MVIVYNPPTGSKISELFSVDGVSLAKPLLPNTTQYCEEEFAKALVVTYPFLQVVTVEEAKELKKAVNKEDVVEKKAENVDDLDIPVAEVEEVKVNDKAAEIPDDLKGTDWYGDGVKEDHG